MIISRYRSLQSPSVPIRRCRVYLRGVALLYHLFLLFYRVGIAVAALWNKKAGLWLKGRQVQWKKLLKQIPGAVPGQQRIWIHCASLGEFEQGRPVIEALKKQSDCIIILTFFSPSGYEVRRNYSGADAVCYLPMDGPHAARRFLDLAQPTQALFVKYEFWHYYIKALRARSIPTILVSGAFRKGQPFFKWWGGFFRKMLSRFSLLTVQDAQSLQLLESIGLGEKAILTGDTRYDRVAQIAAGAKDFPLITQFKGNGRLVIAGSTWPADERILQRCVSDFPEGWRLIVAPHEISAARLSEIRALFGKDCIFYSSLTKPVEAKVLVIDNIGMLSSLYRYGELAWIGGGFNKSGIHNVLEPAVFGLTIYMGPHYQKFREAVDMIEAGIAFSYNFPMNSSWAALLRKSMEHYDETGPEDRELIKAWVQERTGATAKILALLPQAL